MRPRPKKPGETVAEYNAFIATLPKMGGRPKTGGGAPSTPRGTTPTPPKPPKPRLDGGRMGNDISPRRDRDTSPSKPVRVMPGKKPMRVTGGMGMKSGGMVKGKKK